MRSRKWHWISVVFALILVAGCQNDSDNELSEEEPIISSEEESLQHEGDAESLPWVEVNEPRELDMLKQWSEDKTERVIKEVELRYFRGEGEVKVIVYAEEGETDWLRGALMVKGTAFDLGAVAGYRYDKAHHFTIQDQFLFGTEVIKITGLVGASASMTHYIEIDNGVPKRLLLVDTGHATEQDVDHDGYKEVVVSGGTIPETFIYRLNESKIESLNLNEVLQADSVRISKAGVVEAIAMSDSPEVQLYWLRENELTPIVSFTKAEYEAARASEQPYTAEEIREIQKLADHVRIFEPHLPTKDKESLDAVDIVADQEGQLKLIYPEYTIVQSNKDLRPQQEDSEKLFSFPGGRVDWIIDEEGKGAWYFRKGLAYISVSANHDWEASRLLYVVSSLISIEDAKLLVEYTPDEPLQVTTDYLFALQAAQNFATAWASRDPENGLKWVTDEWKSGKDSLQLDAYFRGTSNPHHMTFELNGFRKVDEQTYLFELMLYEYYTAQSDYVNGLPFERDRGWLLEVVKKGENEQGQGIWRVNP